jgi:hypothetical protein
MTSPPAADKIRRAYRRGASVAHAVADHLAAAELDFLAIERAVRLDLDEQLGVGGRTLSPTVGPNMSA